MYTFTAPVIKDARLYWIELPFDPKEAWGVKKGALYVRGHLNGRPFRAKLLSRGGGKFVLVLNRELQKAIGNLGAPVAVELAQDVPPSATTEEAAPPLPVVAPGSLMEGILHRRSIRCFTDNAVEKDALAAILAAGFVAPSAKDKRPVHFVVLQHASTLAALAQTDPNARPLQGAPLAILVCADKVREGTREFLHAACAAATQNMLLCIHSLGLGGVWCGVAANSALYKTLVQQCALPSGILPFSLVACGTPTEEKPPNAHYDPARVHRETW